jgi:distribution and morphology protein 31
MTPSSRSFFTAFYDAVSPLLKVAAPPRRQQQALIRRTCIVANRTFSTLPQRPVACAYSPGRMSASHIKFFGASFVPSAAWTPRSRYVVSRGFAGFCVCTTVPNTAGPATSTAASTVVTETAAIGGGLSPSRKGGILTRLGFRGVHTSPLRRGSRWNVRRQARGMSNPPIPGKKESSATDKPTPGENARADVRGIFERVSHIHRPTKDEMLATATGVWQRLKIRTKWSLIRQMRPYSLEDIGAFFSWLLLGHIVWIVVGTTTFLSVAIFLVNTVVAQGRRAQKQDHELC